MYTMQQYRESADYIAARLGDFRPEILMVLGTGLGFLGDHVENPVVIPYGEIPHFRTSTVSGHQGRFVCGILAGRRVMVMQGRLHIYEGYDACEVTYPVRVARLLGADKLVVTNAAGGVDTNYRVGDLMLMGSAMMWGSISSISLMRLLPAIAALSPEHVHMLPPVAAIL